MKYLFILCLAALLITQAHGQAEFEGIVQYKVDVKSKVPGISDLCMQRAMALAPTMTVTIQRGNYKRESGNATEYYIPGDKRWYFVLKGVDTLFYRDYSEDTSAMPKLVMTNEKKQLAGYNCLSLALKSPEHLQLYYYAPDLYLDPAHDAENLLDHFNMYTANARSIYLASYDETASFTLSCNATNVQPQQVAPETFTLPNLPLQHFAYTSITTQPEFKGAQPFMRFVSLNIDKDVMKYIKVPKGEKHVRQQVRVLFTIDDHGQVINATAVKDDEVNKKLAQEAVRVVNLSSGKWKPANLSGLPIFFTLTQPVTFDLTVE